MLSFLLALSKWFKVSRFGLTTGFGLGGLFGGLFFLFVCGLILRTLGAGAGAGAVDAVNTFTSASTTVGFSIGTL